MNTRKVFVWSVIIALGGFLFGLDTAVISGAEQKIQVLWNLNVFEHGLTVSIALIGTVVGAKGAVIWVFISEIFRMKYEPKARRWAALRIGSWRLLLLSLFPGSPILWVVEIHSCCFR
jgi:MFS family permease